MPTFEWRGRGRTGQDQTGVLVADSKDAVIASLRRQQIVVTAVKEKGKEIAVPKLGGKVPPQLVAVFTRQFSVMIDAGLPLVQCLEILGSQQEHKGFKRALIQVRQDVESGSNLADAMRKHPKIFNDLFTNMVAAGEAGGILDTILQRLAMYIEKAVKLNSQVKSAMIYPVAVISIACIVVTIILWKVIPVFASLFAGLGATLPLPTIIVIHLSNF
ncbi:MAG: type II secretion system F family protein, partial [Acidobacteria bacterium]|nr:type II secretion system F family protein [Acidobacteriota bacterium]